ncbi:hypothetical protein BDW66DRAFT_127472 [Aspergillus desertorum]
MQQLEGRSCRIGSIERRREGKGSSFPRPPWAQVGRSTVGFWDESPYRVAQR